MKEDKYIHYGKFMSLIKTLYTAKDAAAIEELADECVVNVSPCDVCEYYPPTAANKDCVECPAK